MPFTAEVRPTDGDEWRRVVALSLTLNEMLKLRSEYEIRCPDPNCQAKMHPRIPTAAHMHFAHNPMTGDDSCLFRSSGETPAHLEAKAAVSEWIATKLDRYRGCKVDLEQILDNGDVRRIADILVRMPDGEIHVVECQVSAQTIGEYEQRTKDYYALGADYVLWFCDENKLRGPLGEWARTQSEIGYLTIKDEMIDVS